jgi:hypothetical protein
MTSVPGEGSVHRLPPSSAGAGASHAEAGEAHCGHPAHRVVRLFLSYAEANGVRISFMTTSPDQRPTVSRLHRIEGGWCFTVCERCVFEQAS